MLTDIKLKEFPNTPSGDSGRIHPHKFAMWVAIASIIMMFAGLTSAFIVKSNLAGWAEVQTPQVFLFSTVFLFLSSITMQMSLRAFKQRSMQHYRLLIGGTLLLGVVFVVLQWIGFSWLWQHGVRLKGAGAGQFFYIIAGLHALHVIGGMVALTVLCFKAFFGKTKSYNSVPVEVISIYWHFVDILWLYLFIFFIWIG
ncbi:MAG: heme-copper oxidase subunit III [Chitinophagaceae bacterium]